MRIIALILCRNENWVLGASLDAALRWCDGAVVLAHACTTDGLPGEICTETANRFEKPVMILREEDPAFREMDYRQRLLEAGRAMRGTHWALVDPDEVPTANMVEGLRSLCANLEHGQSLDLPMVAVWDGWQYRTDRKWEGARIDVAVKDAPHLHWKAADDGYQHHHRLPRGCVGKVSPTVWGGIMHLQFLSRGRLLAKHAWYKMMERVQYPSKAVSKIDELYSRTPSEEGMNLKELPPEWMKPLRLDLVNVDLPDWHIEEGRRLIREHGWEPFMELELFGFFDELRQ